MRVEWVLAFVQVFIIYQRYQEGNIPLALYWVCITLAMVAMGFVK